MRLSIRLALLTLSVFALSSLNMISARKIRESALRQTGSLMQEKEHRTPVQKKINSGLLFAIKKGKLIP